jgi:hypothetical protein
MALTTAQTQNAAAFASSISAHPVEAAINLAASGVFRLPLSAGAETTLATTQKALLRAPFAFTVTDVRASLYGEASAAAPTFDINRNGTSILTTKLSIDIGDKTSVGATTPYVFDEDEIVFDDDDELTVDVDTAGTGAEGGVVLVYYVRD